MPTIYKLIQAHGGSALLAFGTLTVALLAIVYVIVTSRKVLKSPQGDERMKEISGLIRLGANAYLKRQYKVIGIFFALMFVLLGTLALFGLINPFVPFAFASGGFFSGLSGFIGMRIATAANCRTAEACKSGINRGLKVAFSAGSVMGLTVVGLGLLDISVWFIILKFVAGLSANEITSAMINFGMGASCMALFARVGGGIFTKAADVGADLVGKVEAGIPEDDPRNPACIADNVGDNVGDVAGMGADLYESYVSAVLSAASLGVAAFRQVMPAYSMRALILPFLIASLGIIASIIGTFFIKAGENMTQSALLKVLRRGTNFADIVVLVVSLPLILLFIGTQFWSLYVAIVLGIVAGVIIGQGTEFFTSDSHHPTRNLSNSAKTSSATEIIDGIGLGMLSTVIPVACVSICVLVSYFLCGNATGEFSTNLGLYGVGIAAVGMLSTLGITLATDAYGPVADNAGGIAQMAGLDESVRERTDALDSLGNTTAATGKGFAIGSAALTALALIVSYRDKIVMLNPDFKFELNVINPIVLIGLLIGACMPFVFSALTMKSVGRAAGSVVNEVRQQFTRLDDIISGKVKPDYARCVDICTSSSLKEMIIPSIIVVIVPVAVGLILGVNGVIGMLTGATITGFLLAIFMSNSGGAWDNAKKYIESGHKGGKGSEAHRAAVVGDTIGDPFKDTSGPALNIMIKLISIVSIVFANVVINCNLIGLF